MVQVGVTAAPIKLEMPDTDMTCTVRAEDEAVKLTDIAVAVDLMLDESAKEHAVAAAAAAPPPPP